LVHPPPKLGASEFLASKISFGILEVLGHLAAMHLRLFISGIACNTVKMEQKKRQKDVLFDSNFGWHLVIFCNRIVGFFWLIS